MKSEQLQVFVQKNIELQNQLSGDIHTFTMKLQYIAHNRQVNISRALREISQCGVSLYNSQIFYMDCQNRVYRFLGNFPSKKQIYLNYGYMMQDTITIRFKKMQAQKNNDKNKTVSKRKVKERTVRQALESVKLWRKLYNETDQRGKKKYNLQAAAEIVGIAKKTLDDYYSHLRLAERYNFNFERHMDDKIGVLRSFVRANHRQGYQSPPQRQQIDTSIYWTFPPQSSSQSEDQFPAQ